jgi:CRP/FNR family cyclic AMP-dependent transcriptional regulator
LNPQRLKKIELFAALADDELEQLARHAQETTVDDGAALVKAGTWAYQMFAIEEGTVDVWRREEKVATLKAGDVVGETGAVQRALRNATVRATSPLRLILFTQADIDRVRKEIPDLDEKLHEVLRERSD